MTQENQQEQAGAQAPEQPAAPASKKRSMKRGWIAGVVAAAVVVVAGAGFLAWHEQPSFCNAICHTPMDSYVEGYYSENPTLLAAKHRNAEVECLGCHIPTISEQLSEGVTWVAGGYAYPLEQRSFDDDFCVNSDCHDVSRADLEAKTTRYAYNPHSTYHEQTIACGDCHKAHGPSVNRCTECHGDAELPRYWEEYSPLS